MPSAHTPEWSKIRTLKAKLQTGRCTASGGRVGRELTEEELEDCRERLAQLEHKRDQGIEDRRVARETHENTEQLKEGQREILQAINGVNSRLDTVIAPTGSSAHHKLLAKEAAKRERDLEKVRRHLQQGIVPAEGDFYVGTVLVKADALDQLEELRDRDLEAEFSLTGLPCRLVQISGQSGIVHLLAPDLAVLKGKRKDMGHYHMRLQAFHKDLFYETLAWKAGNGPPVLLDGDDKKLPKKACLRLVVPNIIRIALAKLPVVEVLEERPAKRRAVEPAPGTEPAAPVREAKQDLWEVVEEGSTTAPSTEAEVPEPTEPEPTEQPEPTAIQDGAQDLLLSGKEVWAATVSERTVLLQYVRAAIWGPKQPDIVAKLINPQDADVVAAWSQNLGLPRILVQEQEEIYVSAQFLQAHCKKLSLEGSPRSQRERSRSPRRCKHAAEEEQAPAEDAKPADDKPAEAVPAAQPAEEAEDKPADAQPAEDAKPKLENQQRVQGLVGEIRESWLELYLEDKEIYDDARFRVESGFVFGWVLDCEMILDKEVTPLKELPKFGCLKAGARIRVQIRSLVDRVEAQYQSPTRGRSPSRARRPAGAGPHSSAVGPGPRPGQAHSLLRRGSLGGCQTLLRQHGSLPEDSRTASSVGHLV